MSNYSTTTINSYMKSAYWRFHHQMSVARDTTNFYITPHFSWTVDDFWDLMVCMKKGYIVSDIINGENVFIINPEWESENDWYANYDEWDA